MITIILTICLITIIGQVFANSKYNFLKKSSKHYEFHIVFNRIKHHGFKLLSINIWKYGIFLHICNVNLVFVKKDIEKEPIQKPEDCMQQSLEDEYIQTKYLYEVLDAKADSQKLSDYQIDQWNNYAKRLDELEIALGIKSESEPVDDWIESDNLKTESSFDNKFDFDQYNGAKIRMFNEIYTITNWFYSKLKTDEVLLIAVDEIGITKLLTLEEFKIYQKKFLVYKSELVKSK